MPKLLGLKSRYCPCCHVMTHHRTFYAQVTLDGRRRWIPLLWACTRCQTPSHVVVQEYSLALPSSALPSASRGAIVRALGKGPLAFNQLLADLRRNRTPETSHVFKFEVKTALEYLKANGTVAEALRDATETAFESLRGRRLGSCPKDAQRTLVSLYIQKKAPDHGHRFVPAGVFCLSCEYRRLD